MLNLQSSWPCLLKNGAHWSQWNFQISMHSIAQLCIPAENSSFCTAVLCSCRIAMELFELCTIYAQWEGPSTSVLSQLPQLAFLPLFTLYNSSALQNSLPLSILLFSFKNRDLPHPCYTCEQAQLPVLDLVMVASLLRIVVLLDLREPFVCCWGCILSCLPEMVSQGLGVEAEEFMQLIFVDDYLIKISYWFQ